ncbi:MAG TPA: M67 family metallopeptidase [Myxococcales bacterium]|nr:M67 family metallopeptidase [Myxococcales bacterium]
MTLPFKEIVAHAKACYPRECCGFVIEVDGALRFFPIRNIARDSDEYEMDATEQLKAEQAGRLAIIVHSHPDVGAYFSPRDKSRALFEGQEPWYPGVQYLVVSVRNSRVDGARLFTWDPAAKDFSGEEVPEITSFD